MSGIRTVVGSLSALIIIFAGSPLRLAAAKTSQSSGQSYIGPTSRISLARRR
jgi:hypothetical protein